MRFECNSGMVFFSTSVGVVFAKVHVVPFEMLNIHVCGVKCRESLNSSFLLLFEDIGL